MKRRMLPILIVLLPVALVSLWVYMPRTVPLEECSDLYRRYADNRHVDAAFLRGFRVNDSVAVDVTTLQARDSVGWVLMCQEFNIKPAAPSVSESIARGEDVVTVRLTPHSGPGQPMDTVDMLLNDVLAVSRRDMSIGVFETRTEQEINAVCHSRYQ